MERTPPVAVRRELRREVGYGCPVADCASPYLTWHHFDPPWREIEHHEPQGMIALCGEHHAQADSGAFTREQLHDLKSIGATQNVSIQGRFNWMRNRLLAVVGGSFYYETPIIFQFRGEPAIWFNRDERGALLLNIRMLTVSGAPRMRIEDNFWLTRGEMTDLECPPSGRVLHAKYENSDELRIEFFELRTGQDLNDRYPDANSTHWKIDFPITVVEILERVGQTDVEFGPRWTKLPGGKLKNLFIRDCGVGISLG